MSFGNPLDPDFGQADDIFFGHRALEVFGVGLQPFADGRDHAFPCFLLFNKAVDPVLDEDALERLEMPVFLEFAQLDLEFLFEQVNRTMCRYPKHL